MGIGTEGLVGHHFQNLRLAWREERPDVKFEGDDETEEMQILTFCWPCISVYLSQYLTNLLHKICFTIGVMIPEAV